MCVVSLDQCDCDCHWVEGVRHIMPCCAGKCPTCYRYIKLYAWDRHQGGHRNARDYSQERNYGQTPSA